MPIRQTKAPGAFSRTRHNQRFISKNEYNKRLKEKLDAELKPHQAAIDALKALENPLSVITDDTPPSIRQRIERLRVLNTSPRLQALEMEMCRRSVVHWFNNWAWTYDPRPAAEGKPTWIPFILFPRQVEMLQFIELRVAAKEEGLIEKSRDIGFTWLAGGLALHKYIYSDGFKTTFGSRKEEYVDKIGDPDSIMEKIRMLMRSLPQWMVPKGFNPRLHDNHLRILHPSGSAIIRGEAGDEMGRGGRSTLYIIDEAAHVERGDSVDAATSANANTRIWASSVNGMGNLFARKRFGGVLRADQIFRFHFKDDPRKDDAWEKLTRAKLEPHIFAAEYDIDYAASTEGICIPAAWVQSSQLLRQILIERIYGELPTRGVAGLDVGAGGKGLSVFVPRFGAVVFNPVSWGDPDTVQTAYRGLEEAKRYTWERPDKYVCRIHTMNYDGVGVGSNTARTLKKGVQSNIRVVAVNSGEPPTKNTRWDNGETSEERFQNLRAELWFIMRERLKNAHEHYLSLTDAPGGQAHPISDLLLLPLHSDGPDSATLAAQLSLPRWFKNEKGKIQMESKREMRTRGIASPDHADALSMTFLNDAKLDVWAALGR